MFLHTAWSLSIKFPNLENYLILDIKQTVFRTKPDPAHRELGQHLAADIKVDPYYFRSPHRCARHISLMILF